MAQFTLILSRPGSVTDGVPGDTERAEIRGNVAKDFAPPRALRTLEAEPHTPAQLAVPGKLTGLEVLALDHLGQGLGRRSAGLPTSGR